MTLLLGTSVSRKKLRAILVAGNIEGIYGNLWTNHKRGLNRVTQKVKTAAHSINMDVRRSTANLPRTGTGKGKNTGNSKETYVPTIDWEFSESQWKEIDKADREARLKNSIDTFEKRYLDIIFDWFEWFGEVANGSNRQLSDEEKECSARSLLKALAVRKECLKRGDVEEDFYSEEDFIEVTSSDGDSNGSMDE